MTLVFTVILLALVFEYINGFHDTANSIATVVSTKVLTPRQAVMLAAVMNLIGAMWGTAVAKTISSGLVDARVVTLTASCDEVATRSAEIAKVYAAGESFRDRAAGFLAIPISRVPRDCLIFFRREILHSVN